MLLKAQKIAKSDPSFFTEKILGQKLWQKQLEIKQALRDHRRVTVKSCHGAGKTRTAADIALEWLFLHVDDAIVITTAPTWRQVESILWKEIRGLHARAKVPLGGKLTNTKLEIHNRCFAMGLSTDQSDRFQGYHSENMLVIVDEAAGVPELIYEAIEGLMTTENARLLLIGNPTSSAGTFFNSHRSGIYHRIGISAWDSPNVKEGKIVIPGLVTRDWAEERKQEWGETSPLYAARVLGDFPSEGDDTLFPLKLVDDAIKRQYTFQSQSAFKNAAACIGIDVARFGSDESVLTAVRMPKVILKKKFNGKRVTEIAGWAQQMSDETGIRKFAIDDTGVGGGVTDILAEKGFTVLPINFGSRPTRDDARFRNLKTEIFWFLKDKLKVLCLGEDDSWIEELPTIRYELTSDSMIQIVGKKKMRSQGLKSPDHADSLAIAVWGAFQLYDADLEGFGEGEDLLTDEGLFEIYSDSSVVSV